MAAMPYVHDPKHVRRVLGLVANATTPGTVTIEHLEANGFRQPDAAQVRAFLCDLGLVGPDGRPTSRWAEYRDADEPAAVLAAAIREAYKPLLDATQDAAPSGADLEAVATADHPDHADLVVSTFKALGARAGIALSVPAALVRSRREVLHDVSELLQRSVTEFEQARQCLAHELMRPAHVAAWNSFAALAFAHLATDDFAPLRVNRRRATLPTAELVRIVHGGELVRLLIEHDLIHADDRAALDQLLRQRNDCAHPMAFEPDRTDTAAYLSSILSLSSRLTEATIGGAAPSTPPPPTTPR